MADLVKNIYSRSASSFDNNNISNNLYLQNNLLTIDVSSQFTRLSTPDGSFSFCNRSITAGNTLTYGESANSLSVSSTPLYVEVGTHKRIVS